MSSHADEFDTIVVSRTRAAEGVEFFELGGVDGAALPAWQPGAHIDVLLAAGGERQYSLSGETDAGTWRVGVLREPAGRGGSAWLHDSLEVGATLRVRGPRNHFAFAPVAGVRYQFIAGGIGITPIAPMVAAAALAGADFSLAYVGRSRATMALVGELESRHPDVVAVHAADESNRLDLEALVATLAPGTVVYCCGPTRLIDAVEAVATAAGLAVHVERFEARAAGDPALDTEFEVELQYSGETLTVPAGRSILEAVEDSGVLVLASCREGTCGTCETQVVSGEVDHRDSILTPEERADNTVMYICVSRAKSARLVLEL